jgi:hypothetical protein
MIKLNSLILKILYVKFNKLNILHKILKMYIHNLKWIVSNFYARIKIKNIYNNLLKIL